MSTGKKIKELRKLRKMTQAQLGEASGVVEGAIRNYEREVRTPSEEQLEKIAAALDVPVTALEDYEIDSARAALEALFRMEDAFGIAPGPDGTIAIDHHTLPCVAHITVRHAATGRCRREVDSGPLARHYIERYVANNIAGTVARHIHR